MPRPMITDHWLGVSAGLIHEEKGRSPGAVGFRFGICGKKGIFMISDGATEDRAVLEEMLLAACNRKPARLRPGYNLKWEKLYGASNKKLYPPSNMQYKQYKMQTIPKLYNTKLARMLKLK